ncbi:MAG: sugar phosphate isomerase/epimerase [Clostridia bacterium]|nr:sugar phosphate isomerase/epimerase [Clostridia bacterium]
MLKTISVEDVQKYYGEIEGLKKIKEAGFDGVDYSFFYDFKNYLMPENFKEHYVNIKNTLEDLGLTVYQTHAPFDFRYTQTKEEQEKEIEYIKRSIELTKFFDCKYIVIHRINVPENVDGIEYNVNYFSQFIKCAKENNVKIAIENLISGDLITRPNSLFSIIEKLQEKEKDLFYCCLDTGHANLKNEKSSSFFELLKDNIKVLHIDDNLGDIDSHLLPFKGTVDWNDFATAIKKYNYHGTLNLEVTINNPSKEKLAEAFSSACKLESLIKSI